MFNKVKKYPIVVRFILPLVVLISLFFIFNYNKQENIKIYNGCIDKEIPFITSKKSDIYHKISYCNNDEVTTKLYSNYFKPAKYIKFDYIGNPRGKNTYIYIESKDKKRYRIKQLRVEGDNWSTYILKLPKEFIDKNIRIVAHADKKDKDGWIGVGGVEQYSNINILNFKNYLEVLMHILIFSLWISITYGYFYNKSKRRVVAFSNMAIFNGVFSLILFYIYLYDIKFASLLSIATILYMLYKTFKLERNSISEASKLFTLLFTLMGTITFISFVGVNVLSNYQIISANRWHHLPIDNWIPKFFANAILQGHIPSPLFGTWLSSDRPPMQTAFYLFFTNISTKPSAYFTFTIGMQLLVIVFILFMLLDIVKDRKFIFLSMILIFFNGFVFVNSLFMWPKLFSALYQAIAFYYLYLIWTLKAKKQKHYILFAISSALSFLTHGGGVFYLLSLSILILFTLKNRDSIKYLLKGFFIAILIYLPWVYYQKIIDPPGDRLLKWHLAGLNEPTKDTFFQVLINYYNKITLDYWINLQISHIKDIYNNIYMDIYKIFSIPANEILSKVFFSTNYGYLFFAIFLSILIIFIKNINSKEKKFINLLLISFFIYTIIWSLLLTRGTVVHQGAYFGWFSGFIATLLVVYRFNKYLFYILGALNIYIFTYAYIKDYLFTKGDILTSFMFILMVFIYIYMLNIYSKEVKDDKI